LGHFRFQRLISRLVPSLFLCTSDPCWFPADRGAFVRLLCELGLIKCHSETECAQERYPVGEQFLKLVNFLGCSPSVVLDPGQAETGQTACFLRQHLCADVRFLAAGARPRARCPGCREPAAGIATGAYDAPFTCGRCGETMPVNALDWRQSAGFGRYFLEIGEVYPHEALPSDKLLSTLQDFSGSGWRYFYAG
jgi:hypothetical protein